MALPPLIPREVLFGDPERSSLQISPDGTKLAWLAPDAGVRNVWVAPVDDLSAARAVTDDRARGIRLFLWDATGEGIVYLQDRDGDENWHVYRSDVTSTETIDLTPIDGVHAMPRRNSHERPTEMVVAINDRNPEYHDLHVVDLRTGARTLLFENDAFAEVHVDDAYRLRLAVKATDDGGYEIHRYGTDGFEPWIEVGPDDALTVDVLDLAPDGDLAWCIDSRGRDTAALVELDLTDGTTRELAADPRSDVEAVLHHPVTRRPQAVAFRYDRKRWEVLDESVGDAFELLAGSGRGEVVPAPHRPRDDRLWVGSRVVDDGPTRFFLLDRDAGEIRELFASRPRLERYPLATMHSRIVRSRDGLDLVSYLTLPPGSDPDGDGVPDAPVPMMLLPHGGPWHRDVWGFDPVHQWLANRGYAAMSVNFRSSTGFGKAFVNAGDRAWGSAILEDQQDAVRWAIEHGVADPQRVGVMGGSFGGYSVLGGLAFHPDTFACGVDIVGPSNLRTLLASVPPYWKPMQAMMRRRVGDPDSDEGRRLLEAHSPLSAVDRIAKPLLIAQGANDPRVKQAESDQIVAAMNARGIPVSYVLFPDEGHGFARPQNAVAFFALAEAFLAQVLGGRFEPLGDDLADTSAQILNGRDGIPGLPDDALLPSDGQDA